MLWTREAQPSEWNSIKFDRLVINILQILQTVSLFVSETTSARLPRFDLNSFNWNSIQGPQLVLLYCALLHFLLYLITKTNKQNSIQKLLSEQYRKNKHVVCSPWSVRIGKNCALVLSTALNLRPYSRPQTQFFPNIWTSRLANSIYLDGACFSGTSIWPVFPQQ